MKRCFLIAGLVAILLTLPVRGQEPSPSPDPREVRIQELERQVREQSDQIKELQEAVRALQPQAAAPAPQASPDDENVPGPEPPPPMPVTAVPTSSGTGAQSQLNPNISAILLAGGQVGGAPDDPLKNRFFLDEAEIAIQAPIDPFARADLYLTWPFRESPEVEEATITYSALPANLQVKGGLLRGDFGRINPLHKHALPQIDPPLPNKVILGEESLRDPGVEASWLVPLPWYSKLSTQVLSRSVTAEDGEFQLFPDDGSNNPIYLGRWENLWDLDDESTIQLGLSGATSAMNSVIYSDARVVGADLTYKWRPLENSFRNLTWQTEILLAAQDYNDPSIGTRNFGGWYTFVNYQWDRNWRGGARYDTVTDPLDPSQRLKRISALLEYIPSEWQAIRLQYDHNMPNYGPTYDAIMLQWNIAVGPHGVHKY